MAATARITGDTVDYATLDVFTSEPYAGNQLAIVLLSATTKLSQAGKQAIAREFNLSETVFLHAKSPDGGTKCRADIFTKFEELPFAGHPVIGTICYVAAHDPQSQPASGQISSVDLHIKAGSVEGQYDWQSGMAWASIPHSVHVHSTRLHASYFLASQTGIHGNGLQEASYPVVSVVKGMTFILVQLDDLQALGTLQAERQSIEQNAIRLDEEWSPSFVAPYYFVIERKVGDTTFIRSRMIEPNIGEDPCTGSAASTLAAFLALKAGIPYSTSDYVIIQGVEMRRQGTIHAQISLDSTGHAVTSVKLGGRATIVSTGKMIVPLG